MVSEAATCSLDCALLTERKLRSAFSDVCFHHHLQLDPRFQLQSSQSAVFNHQYGGFSPSSEQSLDDSANHTPRSSGCRSPDVSSLTNPSKNSQIASTCKSSVVSLHRSYHTNDFPAQEFDVSPADIKPLPPLSTTGSTRLEKYPLAKDTILIENVPVKNPTLDPSLAAMVPQLRALSICCFNEDTTVLISKKTGWRMNLLVTPDKMHLLGFLSYRVRGSVLEISKLAVCDDCRNRGASLVVPISFDFFTQRMFRCRSASIVCPNYMS